MVADLPISLVALGLAWHYGLFAVIWIVVVGTLWWWFLSCAVKFAFGRLSELRDRPPASIFSEDRKGRNTRRAPGDR